MNLIIFFISKPLFYESWYFKYKSIYNFHLLSKQDRILCQNNYFSSLDNLLILAGLPVKTHCLGMFYTEFSHIIWNLFKQNLARPGFIRSYFHKMEAILFSLDAIKVTFKREWSRAAIFGSWLKPKKCDRKHPKYIGQWKLLWLLFIHRDIFLLLK